MGWHLEGGARTTFLEQPSVINVRTGTVSKPAGVLIERGRISRIASGPIEVPQDAEIIDASGKYLIPGLIDMHIHYRDWAPELFVNHGVTTVRDNGNNLQWIISLKHLDEQRLRDVAGNDWSSRSGPRISVAAVFADHETGKGHHAAPRTPVEAARMVELMHSAGADGIKVHGGVEAQILRAITREAHVCGMRVTSHVGAGFDIIEGLKSGLDCIEHSFGFAVEPVTTTPDVINAMLDVGARWCPTVTIDERDLFEDPVGWGDVIGSTAADAKHVQSVLDAPGTDYFPKIWKRIIRTNYPDGGRRPTKDSTRQEGFKRFQEAAQQFREGGGRFLSGTDTLFASIPGFSLQEELSSYVRLLGMEPAEALRAATSNAADYIGKTGTLGEICQGAEADMVLLRENPLQDIDSVRSIDTVWQQGQRVNLGYQSDFNPLLRRPELPFSPEHLEFMLQYE